MIAAPYYLLAIGIFTLIAGYFLAAIAGPDEAPPIDPRMSDEEIANNLQQQESMHWTSFVIVAGYAAIGVSVIWRFVRSFL